jgi:hypothetical protein
MNQAVNHMHYALFHCLFTAYVLNWQYALLFMVQVKFTLSLMVQVKQLGAAS